MKNDKEKKSLGAFIKKIFKYILNTIIIIIVLSAAIIFAIRTVKYFQLKLKGDNAIQEEDYADIGGIKQYIQIRGNDINNPVILVVHGGPGQPLSPYSYYWQTYIENDYTIVQWDQRGCGRTYYANKDVDYSNNSIDLFLSDLDEVVNYLTSKLNKEKVIVLGHSWGSVLGAMYAQNHPEKLEAYIGAGQLINSIEAEKIAAEEAARIADNNNNAIDRETILTMYDNISDGDTNVLKFAELNNITAYFLPAGASTSSLYQMWMTVISPYFGWNDLKWYMYSRENSQEYYSINEPLYKKLYEGDGINFYDMNMEYQVPVYFISGNRDWVTPYKMVQEYYQAITAPDKDMILMERVGHNLYLDNPREFANEIKNALSE